VKAAVRAALCDELKLATAAARLGDDERSWRHLERAHILSQLHAWPHVWVHLRMLAAGFRRGDRREVVGQLLRLIVAAPGSWLGKAPKGNTGGANVGIFTPMPIPEDLRRILSA
jgi:hypothetical protein